MRFVVRKKRHIFSTGSHQCIRDKFLTTQIRFAGFSFFFFIKVIFFVGEILEFVKMSFDTRLFMLMTFKMRHRVAFYCIPDNFHLCCTLKRTQWNHHASEVYVFKGRNLIGRCTLSTRSREII